MTEILFLRLVHVLAGTVWVGSGVFSTVFLMPVLTRSGPAAGAIMAGLQQRKLFTFMPAVALLTIGSGLRLMWITSGGLGSAWFATPVGQAFGASGAAAIVAFLLAMFGMRPMSVKAAQLSAAATAATDEQERTRSVSRANVLRGRAAVFGNLALGLLVVGAAGMSVARYLT